MFHCRPCLYLGHENGKGSKRRRSVNTNIDLKCEILKLCRTEEEMVYTLPIRMRVLVAMTKNLRVIQKN